MLIVSLISIVIGLQFTSATFSLSNYADFKPNEGSKYGTIDIWDGNLILPDERIASYTLLSNTEKCFEDCEAGGNAILYSNGSLFEDVSFINLMNGKDTTIQSHQFYILKNVSKQISTPIYEKICTASNGTREICINEIIDYENKTEYREEWVEYNKEELAFGSYQWKLKGKKDSTQSVDWIALSNNVKLKEWADWTAANCFTGGTVVIDGEYCVNTFTGNGTFAVTDNVNVAALVVAGGGGGGDIVGGGGGAGGLIYNSSYDVAIANYAIVVGYGGNANLNPTLPLNGSNSTFGALSALGGGAGGQWSGNPGQQGGSGGGGAGVGGAGATGLAGQGNNGGTAFGTTSYGAGAGGGAGAVGADGASNTGGTGGVGLSNNINGTNVFYAGGGGGAGQTTGGAGGNGGGGEGGDNGGSPSASSGVNGTGGGGGGTRDTAPPGNGGRGIVIIRYLASGLTATASYPSNNIQTLDNTVGIGCNFTGSGNINISSVNLTVWNASNFISYGNTTGSLNTPSYNETWTTTPLADGNYTWNCRGFGTSGYNDTIANRTFYVDTSSPIINLLLPINGVYNYSNVSLNYSASDPHLQACWFSINGGITNTTIANCINSTANLAPRNNTIRIWANDSLGQTGNSTTNYSYYFPILQICNASTPLKFINFTFKNETVLQQSVNATIDSTWTYWFDNGVNRSLSYANTSATPSYAFCIDGGGNTLSAQPDINYANAESLQRTYRPGTLSLTNITTNQTLFLLPTSGGIYVSFQVQTVGGTKISGAIVNITRTGYGQIAADATDDSGIATFFLDPLVSYTIHTSAAGYTSVTSAITPSQSSYTIILGAVAATASDYIQGITFTTSPIGVELNNNTNYVFNFTISSSFWGLSSYGFTLVNSSGFVLNSTSGSVSAGSSVAVNHSTGNLSYIRMNYFWVINNSYQNGSVNWIIVDTSASGWSLSNLFTDLTLYLTQGDGLFGLRRGTSDGDFSLAIIIFIIIFGFAGIMSYQYGLTSSGAIVFIIFSAVLFFDVGLGIMPNPIGAVPHFITFFMAIALVGVIIKEAMS